MASDTPRNGDVVNVTIEGVVVKTDKLQRFVEVAGVHVPLHAKGVQVEVVERPFAETTVVKTNAGFAVRTGLGQWVYTLTGGASSILTDEMVREQVTGGAYKVIYDPANA